MNKIIYYTVGFLISIVCVFMTLFTEPESFYGWLGVAILLLLCPIIFHKICKPTQFSKEQSALLCQLMILYMLAFVGYQCLFPKNNDYMIAITTSLDKANEIQNFLTTDTRATKRHILFYEIDNEKHYGISVGDLGRKKNHEVTLELLNSNIIDETVQFSLNTKYTKDRKKMLKRIKKECEDILYGIDGMAFVHVYIESPENLYVDNVKLKSVSVYYETEDDADSKKIRKQVEDFINLFKDSAEKIEIKDLTADTKAY